MIEGFLELSDSDLINGSANNLFAYRDLFSPFSNVDRLSAVRSEKIYVDSKYGLVFSDWDEVDCQFYGSTELLPDQPLDELANRGFLRVPFTRIPRIAVGSRAEIDTCISAVTSSISPGSVVLFRGQSAEFQIERSNSARMNLYGSSDEIEPSLVPSGSRSNLNIDSIMPAWCGLLQWGIDVLPEVLGPPMDHAARHAWYSNYTFRRFALGMAQHYGLPSNGLDVTDKLDTALFFANYKFQLLDEPTGHARYQQKTDWHTPSVIYVLSLPSSGHGIDFGKNAPTKNLVKAIRPSSQSAHFLHRGWGMASNDAARWIVAAIYLENDLELQLPSVAELFPTSADDPFAALLEAAKQRPDRFPEAINRYLNHYYYIDTK